MNKLVSIAGAGNLAWHLAPALDNAGYAVREVYSRNPRHAEQLVERLYEAEVKATLDFSTSPSSVFILAVSDDALEEVAREIILPEDAILVHTSGSQPLSRLGYAATENIGVFYPLQVFKKHRKISLSDTPIFIETELSDTERALMDMARAISKTVQSVDSKRRKALHLASVFASQFTNHMISISNDLANENRLNFEWFKPLVAETINQCLTAGPDAFLSGPAYRGDLELLDYHMEFLREDAGRAEVYRVISQHIMDSAY